MKKKSNAGLWVALGVGGYVGLWVLAALMGWTTVINILIVFTAAVAAGGIAALFMKGRAKRQANKLEREQREQARKEPVTRTAAAAKKSYGPEIDPIIQEGNRALSEMGRLYMSIKDPVVRQKINELMRITDKITQDAIADPSDVPQIRKFMNYYLPTTIKLLNAYDRMSSQGIEGENLDKSMKNINEMLDAAIDAYKKRLDSLFEDQALDIETDIEVMNTMLAREGLSGNKDFDI
ncbi:MAG: 5-bromo-4-chloroindolyl phosphate hydrolysis family protein [Oscillospiraceae bacterium]|nr:5-bromo-4-chloroindolyl phosphate hydrolysis family protein [Oscillospiraceae bacterium]